MNDEFLRSEEEDCPLSLLESEKDSLENLLSLKLPDSLQSESELQAELLLLVSRGKDLQSSPLILVLIKSLEIQNLFLA